ncbi:CHAD domain-containing protein [Rhizobium rhizoryzae]|uniref:Uncharacterized protein with PIN domain n=1 Tax=Rhizobium rhizoryzae TaxID=451876 RepID=A0A7W6LIT2_9HYPH|nr:CHAD domain-containing protein [Rhizobium rhizoryzae]MBB4143992.1 uncharacterized protein with PIN domain [Rhizobium rhizoryzae]
MAFRIRPSRSFPQEFRRVTRSQLNVAIETLQQRENGVHEAIHAARKRFKRVRALYRLIEPDSKDFRHRENARIRDMAKSLSTVRDATALVETLDYLQSVTDQPDELRSLAEVQSCLRDRRDRIASEEEHDLERKLSDAVATCTDAVAALDELEISASRARTARRLERVWAKQLRKAQRAITACHETRAEDAFHELRKCGQIYWMHLAILRDLWPTAMKAKESEARALVALLGHEHDLSVLLQVINEDPALVPDSDSLAHLYAAIIRSQQSLREQTLDRASHVFAEDPAREASIIATLWSEASD